MNRKSDICHAERNCIEIRGSESRKVRKPLMEKKRRARINQSLNDLKRLLLETDTVKKEGSRPTKLEKADVLELTVNYVQKLHQERGNVRRTSIDNRCDGCSSARSPSSGGSAKFNSGYQECLGLIRQVLNDQPLQKVEGNLTERVIQHLERCLTNMDSQEIMKQRSPSPSIQSDSCSSFDEKDTVTSSPVSLVASPAHYGGTCSTSSVLDETESQHYFPRRSSLSSQYDLNSFETTPSSNASSPIDSANHDTTSSSILNVQPSRWTCGFQSVPVQVSPVLTAGNWNHNGNSKWENRQVAASSMLLCESNKWEMSDAHSMESWTSCPPQTSISPTHSFSNVSSPLQRPKPSPIQQLNLYNHHFSSIVPIPSMSKTSVWRPW